VETQNPAKVYVSVTADFNENGQMIPLTITWEDGRTFVIDRITDIRRAAAMKAGGNGDRYTVRIAGRESYLFFERTGISRSSAAVGRWFVERKAPRSASGTGRQS